MIIREYDRKDSKAITKLFYDTVHTINRKDYTRAQLNVWVDGYPDLDLWTSRFLSSHTLVAFDDGVLVGFGNIDDQGCLDMLYVHKDHQHKHIATMLCDQLEKLTQCKITTYASITAKGFFEKRGYKLIKTNNVIRKGIALTNFLMEKE